MIPILKEPVWHELSNCLEKFPISMTAKQLEEYLLKLKIIKDTQQEINDYRFV